MTSIKHVGVVGAGQMGRGITEVCARAGLHVTLCDVTEDRARAGLAGVADSLLEAEKRGVVAPGDRAPARTVEVEGLTSTSGPSGET